MGSSPPISMIRSFIPSFPSPLRPRSQTLTLNLIPTPRLLSTPGRPPRLLSNPYRRSPPPLSSSTPTDAFHFEDLVEKDWSFLDADPDNHDHAVSARRIVAAARVRSDSRVLVSMGTVGFVDRLAEIAPCELVMAVHESLFALAMIKEKHDGVRCWQGGIDDVPERFGPFDVVFLCYLPGMAASLDEILSLLAARCSRGARLVISFDQGKTTIKQHQQQFPDMITSDLPDRTALEKAAIAHSFHMSEFVDEPTFYLAVLRYSES